MLIAVPLNELETASILSFHLYDAQGDVLMHAGSPLGTQTLGKLRRQHRRVYRHARQLPIVHDDGLSHEGIVLAFPSKLSAEDKNQRALEDQQPDIYSNEALYGFAHALGPFWKALETGSPADVALCEVAANQLIADITTHADQIQYMSQLHVRDPFTYSHTIDVAAVSVALAVKAGYSSAEVRDVALAALLHDLGKLQIPKSIMFKQTRLTEKEFEVMKLHPAMGYKVIRETLGLSDAIARPALEHQEMYGGGGYPYNLSGDAIHPYSHIVKIADVYDALTSRRPYKEAIPSERAIDIMRSEGDKSFHPELFEMFMAMANYH